MSDNQVIPDAAVEAAFAALFPKEPTPSSFKSAVWEPTIKTILEAAAPHMRVFPGGRNQAEWEKYLDSYR